MKLGKYKFNSKEQFENKLNALHKENEQGDLIPLVRFEKAILGNIVLVPESTDEDGIITEAILSDGYHVDMVWFELTEHPYGWKSYYVDLNGNGSHKIAGLNYVDFKI